MTVDIDIDLKAKGVADDILKIRGAMEALDRTSGDLDLGDAINVDGVTGSLDEIITKMGKFQDELDNIDTKIKKTTDNIPEKIKTQVEHEYKGKTDSGTGGGGDGGKTTGGDPPSGDDNRKRSDRMQDLSDLLGVDVVDFKGSDDDLDNFKESYRESLNEVKQTRLPGVDNKWGTPEGAGLEGKEASGIPKSLIQGNGPTIPPNYAKGKSIHLTDQQDKGIDPENVIIEGGFGRETLSSYKRRENMFSQEEIADMKAGNGADLPDEDDPLSRKEYMEKISKQFGLDSDKLRAGPNGNNLMYDSELGDRSLGSFLNAREQLSGSEKRDIIGQAPGDDGPLNMKQRKSKMDLFEKSKTGKFLNDIDSPKDGISKLRNRNRGIGSYVKKAFPSMGKYMQLLAALIPIAVTLGTQLLGVASAMGAVGVAGASIMSLGLIGHGDSMAGSFAQAKQEIKDLKEEMFDAVQPLAQMFAPIQSRMFDAIPGAMGGIFDSMEGLTQFEGLLFDLGSAGASGIARFFDIINANAGIIDDLTREFAGLIGTGLLNFFNWLLKNAADNKQMMLETISVLKHLVVIGFNLASMLTKLIVKFEPLLWVGAKIANLFNNRLGIAILSFIAMATIVLMIVVKVILTMGALVSAISSLAGAFAFMTSMFPGVAAFFTTLGGYITTAIAQYGLLATAAMTAAGAIAATGIGLALVGGGLAALDAMQPDAVGGNATSGMAVGGGGGKTVYNDNRSYEVSGASGDDYASVKQVGKEIERASERDAATSRPDVNIK
jgi:hypothetical protein